MDFMACVLVFGDSIAYGYGAKAGWVQLFRNWITEMGKDIEVYNLGISGDTSSGLSARLACEAEARKSSKMLIVVSIGINDSEVELSSGKNRISPEEFRRNMEKIIETARGYGEVLLLGLTPVDESLVRPIPWHKGYEYTNKSILKYDSIIHELASSHGVRYIRLFQKLSASELADGVHPDARGHEKIFEAVREYIAREEMI